ncbi:MULTISPECIES: sigma factor-like helix-turn-helix DNA-binding protein [unclassified Paenibacillus]|uniref:sigma factor-like helix-turn-helix DNA-binding protein n=1 Tax=unclassified Paenibacillus TaxID=185978 RepID=UPI0036D424FA
MFDVNPERLTEPKAYLCKMTANRCRDMLKSARNKRERYVGEWLPEPIYTGQEDAYEAVERGELLSYAMLVLLEKLSPAERAVLVLREALSFDYTDIAEIVGKSEANCRKLLSRAKGKMGFAVEEKIQPEAGNAQWVGRFLTALEHNHVDEVVSMLAEDVMLVSDGGGKVVAAIHPIVSRDAILKFIFGLLRKASQQDGQMRFELKNVNGQPGVVFYTGAEIETVVLLHVEEGLLRRIYFVRNPDKLNHL